MKMFVKSLLFVSFLLFSMTPKVSASEYHGIQVTKVDTPENLQVEVSEQCSGHQNFEQVSVREDGAFAIFTMNRNWEETPELVFKRKYIDIYDKNGAFIQEIAFTSRFSSVMEFTGNEIIVYFHYNILTYDLVTETFCYYTLPEGESYDTDFFVSLRKTNFDRGSWTYNCERALDGYTALTRTDGTHEQVLVSYPGTRITVLNTIVRPFVYCAIICLIGFWYKKRKKITE